jgi:hypothetical protein
MYWTHWVRAFSLNLYNPQLITSDPEVATLTSLTNVQNSLFIPNLPWLNRRPTYNLRRRPSETESLENINRILAPLRDAQAEEQTAPPRFRRSETEGTTATLATIDSQLSESRYAVLPEGASLQGWTKHDKAEVNDHVRHMLHSKRSKFKRTMRGFGQYVRRRKYCSITTKGRPLIATSTWLPGHTLCHTHHALWSCLGALPHRLDQRRRKADLRCPHHRQRIGGSLRRRW